MKKRSISSDLLGIARFTKYLLISNFILNIILVGLAYATQGPPEKEIEYSYTINFGKVDYTEGDTIHFGPLTQQDYVQISVPSIYLSRYLRSFWLFSKNDVLLTLSVDNGDGNLHVYKTDVISKQRSGRFVPIFNAIVMPIEILKGNYLTIHVEGYSIYKNERDRIKSISDTVLASITPLIPTEYSPAVSTAGIVLGAFNSLLSLKQDDEIFNFSITFDVLAHERAKTSYFDDVNNGKVARQLILRAKKYPIVNTNDPYPLTLKKDFVSLAEN